MSRHVMNSTTKIAARFLFPQYMQQTDFLNVQINPTVESLGQEGALHTVDWLWIQKGSNESQIKNMPPSIQAIVNKSTPVFCWRMVLYPSSPHGQVFPTVVVFRVCPQPLAIYSASFNLGATQWSQWTRIDSVADSA